MSRVHIFTDGERIATFSAPTSGGGTFAYHHTDHLGSTAVNTDEAGTVVELLDYYPYGSQQLSEGTYDDTYTFTGKELDDTNLYYFEARYYNADTGRFVAQDPLFWNPTERYIMDPQQWNSYAYSRNNPVRYVDPTGQASLEATFRKVFETLASAIRSVSTTFNSVLSSNSSATQNNQHITPSVSLFRNTTWDPVTNDRIRQLDSRVQQPATNFINNTESQLGVQLRVTEGVRSVEKQNELYNMGRFGNPGPVVTGAKGGESYHQYGRAIDVVVMEDGQAVWDPITDEVAQIGEAQGFEWGGRWRANPDYPHFEMPLGQSVFELYQDYLMGR